MHENTGIAIDTITSTTTIETVTGVRGEDMMRMTRDIAADTARTIVDAARLDHRDLPRARLKGAATIDAIVEMGTLVDDTLIRA